MSLSEVVKVTYVDVECDESHGNPAVAYLRPHGSAKFAPAPIPVAAKYHLTSSTNPSPYHAPSTDELHLKVSGLAKPLPWHQIRSSLKHVLVKARGSRMSRTRSRDLRTTRSHIMRCWARKIPQSHQTCLLTQRLTHIRTMLSPLGSLRALRSAHRETERQHR